MKNLTRFALALPVLGALFSAPALADDCPFYESRSGLCGYYASEISSANAFVDTVVKRGKWSNPQLHPVIIDVRSTPEYKAGHPEHSYNVPYPFIYQKCDSGERSEDGACIGGGPRVMQDDQAFVDFVKKIAPNPDTPIYTLCRTGVRSVGAANALTNLGGYKNVSNIWEGFVGVNFTYNGENLDLNHSGGLDNGDLNGWRYYQGLPYDTRLLPKLMYKDPLHPGIYAMD
jgi:rhodanese-related sulfurtransferase